MAVIVVLLALVVLAVVALVVLYNGLVRMRNRVEAAWAQIEVQLARRADLIPNLVETVKGYAAHERATLDAVVSARNRAVAASGPHEKAAADNLLSGALRSVFALAEAYPELEANRSYLDLQEALTGTEDRIAYARQFYNDSVNRYNTRVQSVPWSVLARWFRFTEREYFEAGGEARGPVDVQF